MANTPKPEQRNLIPPDERFAQEDWEQYEVGITPLPPIRQMLQETNILRPRGQYGSEGVWAPRILDVGAGSGSFGVAIRELDNTVVGELVAVEVRPSERAQLEKIYDTVVIGSFDDPCLRADLGAFDLVVGNPPFKRMRPVKDASEPTWLDFMLDRLRGFESRIVQLMPSDYCLRRKVEADYLRTHVPCAEYGIPGRMAYFGGSSTDIRTYSWWEWQSVARALFWERLRDKPFSWTRQVLPALEAEQLRWRTRPGDEL